MSSPTISKGYNWESGATVTPNRLNDHVDDATIQCTKTDVVLGRSTSGAGVAEEIDCTAAGRALIDDASAAAQRTTLGLGTIATQNATAVAFTGGSAKLDYYAAPSDALAYGATVNLDFSTAAKTAQTIALTGNLTLTTSNLANGASKVIRLSADGSARTLTFPTDWTFYGLARPATIAAGKKGMLNLFSYGTTDADVSACWVPQP